jgi:ABC-type phosphate transport system substrate-binding protein
MALFAVLVLAVLASVNAQPWLGKQCSTTAGGATSLSDLAPQFINKCACGCTAYAAVGSGTGIANFISGVYCVGVSDDPMTVVQDAQAGPGKKLTIPIVISVYGFFAGGATNIVAKMDYAGTYNVFFGGVSTWGQSPYFGAPLSGVSGHITPIYRADSSGTTFVVKKFWQVAGKKTVLPFDETTFAKTSPMIVAGAKGVSGGQAMCNTIGATRGSLGYSQTGLCLGKRLALTEVYIKNAAGFYIQGSGATAVPNQAIGRTQPARTSSWASYVTVFQQGQSTPPMVSFEYFFLRDTYAGVTQGPAAVNLVYFCNTKGQSLGTPYGFNALPTSVAGANSAAIIKVPK